MGRGKVAKILLLPVVAIMFIVGWVLSMAGEQRSTSKRAVKKENATKDKDEYLKDAILPEAETIEVAPDLEASRRKRGPA